MFPDDADLLVYSVPPVVPTVDRQALLAGNRADLPAERQWKLWAESLALSRFAVVEIYFEVRSFPCRDIYAGQLLCCLCSW